MKKIIIIIIKIKIKKIIIFKKTVNDIYLIMFISIIKCYYYLFV